jgi:Na+/H+ antiporter NhaD/arsenite permease-like protein
MSVELVSIIVLAVIFLIATVRPVNLGALAIVAAFVLGLSVLDGDLDERTDAVFAGFPGELFLILVGVTYLFAIASANGTVDWLVQVAIRAVQGRIGLIPWIMFLVTACLTAMGAVVPASVAIIAPIGMGFAVTYGINPLMMGLLIINGASAGGFSPISIFGGITNGVVEEAGLPGNPTLLFLASFFVNLAISVVAFFLWGGRELFGRRVDAAPEEPEPSSPGSGGSAPVAVATEKPPVLTLDRHRIMTITGLVVLAVTALFFEISVGVVAITVAVILTLLSPQSAKDAVSNVAWPTVLLVCGIVLYVGVMQTIGTIDWLGEEVATVGTPLVAALVICFIGAAVSAFASTTGILGALIPLAVPFLTGTDAVGAVGLITALALSSSIVDSSPFSTSGALTVANAPEDRRDYVYRGLMKWGFSMVVLIPIATWLIFVVPGWL